MVAGVPSQSWQLRPRLLEAVLDGCDLWQSRASTHTQTLTHTHRHAHVMIWIHEQGSEKCFQELLDTALSATRNCLGKLQSTSPQKSQRLWSALIWEETSRNAVPFIHATFQGCPNWMVLVHKHIPMCAPMGTCAHSPPQHTHRWYQEVRQVWIWSEQLWSPMSIIKEDAVEAALLCPLSVHLLSHGYLGTLTVSWQLWARWRCVTGKRCRVQTRILFSWLLAASRELTPSHVLYIVASGNTCVWETVTLRGKCAWELLVRAPACVQMHSSNHLVCVQCRRLWDGNASCPIHPLAAWEYHCTRNNGEEKRGCVCEFHTCFMITTSGLKWKHNKLALKNNAVY